MHVHFSSFLPILSYLTRVCMNHEVVVGLLVMVNSIVHILDLLSWWFFYGFNHGIHHHLSPPLARNVWNLFSKHSGKANPRKNDNNCGGDTVVGWNPAPPFGCIKPLCLMGINYLSLNWWVYRISAISSTYLLAENIVIFLPTTLSKSKCAGIEQLPLVPFYQGKNSSTHFFWRGLLVS